MQSKLNDKKIVILWSILFFISLYFSMLVKKMNDIIDINTNEYSIINNYINLIEKSNMLSNFHEICIKYNYTYVPIFIITFMSALHFSVLGCWGTVVLAYGTWVGELLIGLLGIVASSCS